MRHDSWIEAERQPSSGFTRLGGARKIRRAFTSIRRLMSYYQNESQHQPDRALAVALVIGVLIVVGAVAALSKSVADALGADVWVVLGAMGRMTGGLIFFGGLVIGGAFCGIFRRVEWMFCLLLAVTASVMWWCFGTVLDSMALGGLDPASTVAFPWNNYWWDSWWFQWGVSALLLIPVIVCAIAAMDD
jgi:hypothetical protein